MIPEWPVRRQRRIATTIAVLAEVRRRIALHHVRRAVRIAVLTRAHEMLHAEKS